jgi:protein tyrosine kinase modulator
MSEPEEGRPGIGLAAAREALSRRRWLVLLTFAGAFLAVASLALFLPDVYRSSATVLIDRQQIPAELVRSTVTSDLEIRLHTISQEILSRARLQGLIERFDLYPDLRKHALVEDVVERMREDIQLNLLRGTDRRSDRGERGTVAFKISYTGTDAQKAAVVANTLASFYIEENLKAREKQAAGTAEFLSVQLEETKRRLEEQERQVGAFKERHIGALPQQMEANLATLEQLSNQLRVNSENQLQVSERRAAVEKQLGELDGANAPGGPRQLADLRRQLTQLQTRYSDKYPDVVRVKGEIAALERQAEEQQAEQPARVPVNPQVVELRASLAQLEARSRGLQSEADMLRAALGRYQTRVENVPRTEQEFQRLARDYETNKELYRSLLMRQREAEVAESMEQRQKGEQFRVIESALASQKPTAPNRPQLIGLGFLLALGLAAAALVVAEHLDTSFHSVEDLRRHARAPVLVSIPRVETEAAQHAHRRRVGLAALAATACAVLIVAGSYALASGNAVLAALMRSAE